VIGTKAEVASAAYGTSGQFNLERFGSGHDPSEKLILADFHMQLVHDVVVFGRTASP
jgi:hypothetical protein